MKDMTPLQRKKGAALVLARICEAYGRMLLLEGLFQVGTWSSRAFWQCLRSLKPLVHGSAGAVIYGHL